jgi:hypothetical protein
LISVAVLLIAGSTAFATDIPGWSSFVIRNNSGSVAPTISDYSGGGKLFQIGLTGQKAGWGTNLVTGVRIGDIQSIGITRDATVTGCGPYMNFWVTDGHGGYAVLSNEPSHTAEWTGSSPYNTTWDVLRNATSWVYEASSTGGFVLPNGTTTKSNLGAGTSPHLTFNDFANYRIAVPTSHWGGTGAPDDLNAGSYTAYGVNWVFGDTQSNYLGGYLVSNPFVVPEPGMLSLLIAAGVCSAAYICRRRRS